MTILAFYPVSNDNCWDRDEFESCSDEKAFKELWADRDLVGTRFYCPEIDSPTTELATGNEFETDYNDELLDGGWWVKVLHLNEKFVKEVMAYPA